MEMAVDHVLKKSLWSGLTALVAVVAFLHATGIMPLDGAPIASDERPLALPPPLAEAAAPVASAPLLPLLDDARTDDGLEPGDPLNALDPVISSGIHRLSATEITIDRRVVDTILEHQDELMRWFWLIPDVQNGKMVGIRIFARGGDRVDDRQFGVSPDALLRAFGIRSGDLLLTVNCVEVENPERVREAFAPLRKADHFSVYAERRGERIDVEYTIK